MFTLLDNGEIAIDFTIAGEGDTPDETRTVTVAPPPTFGAYKRLRGEVDRLNRGRDNKATELRDDPDVGPAVMQTALAAYTEDSAIDWWRFVMIGDDSYRGQATEAPPEDVDSWPAYLTSNDAITQALTHWKSVPLARGVKPAPATS